jgi:hypothetical protein
MSCNQPNCFFAERLESCIWVCFVSHVLLQYKDMAQHQLQFRVEFGGFASILWHSLSTPSPKFGHNSLFDR